MPRSVIIAIRISTWPMWRGSRVNSGSSANGRGLRTIRSTQSPGMSTRGTSSTISLTWTTVTPSEKATASAMVGVSSVPGPVNRFPSRSACSAQSSATFGMRSTNIRAYSST